MKAFYRFALVFEKSCIACFVGCVFLTPMHRWSIVFCQTLVLRGSNRIRGCREIGTKWNQSEGGTEIGGRGTEMGPKRDRNGTELGTEMGPKSKDRFYIGFFAIFSPVPLRAPQAPDQFGHQIFIRFGYRTRDPHCQAEFTPE